MSTQTASDTDRISSPVVMGALAALTALGTSLAVCVVPALAAQLDSSRSALSVLGAVQLGVDAMVLGHGGRLELSGGAIEGTVRLMPMGLTLVHLGVAGAVMRRMGRALSLVTVAGGLRARALQDAGAALGAFVVLYAIGGALLSALTRTPHVHVISSASLICFGIVALIGGGGGLLWALRRREAPGIPAVRVLDLLPAPYDVAARGAAIALLGLLAAGLLTTVGFLVAGLGHAGALMDQLDPGIIGGIVLTLLQLALLPTVSVWALAALLGGRFAVGVGTSISLGASSTGVLPALPLLAVLPQPGAAPWWSYLLLALPITAIGAGSMRVVRDVAGSDLRTRAIAWGSYAGAVVLGTVLLLGLATGQIGAARLADLGPHLGTAILPLLGMVAGTLGLAILIWDSSALDALRAGVASLRSRVERAEAKEASPDSAQGTAPGTAPGSLRGSASGAAASASATADAGDEDAEVSPPAGS